MGQKIVMAITGLSLTGFLVAHLGGNLNLFAGEAAFNGYAEKLHSLGPLLAVAEVGLFGLFVGHLLLALSTSAMSRKARRKNYEVKESKQSGFVLPNGGAADRMLVTGLVVGAYMIWHVVEMKLNVRGFEGEESKYQLVRNILRNPINAVIYPLALVALGIHLSHGIASALQTLGLNSKRWHKFLKVGGMGLAWILAVGFLAVVAWAFAFPPHS